jgi:Amt family ammonium transporter
MRIDDPVGAVPVHFVNGIWGCLAVGIFANANPDTAAWNGVPTAVTGLLYGGSTQILAQLAQVVAVGLTATVLSFGFFKILAAFKLLRSEVAHELAGLDMPEMGASGYTTDDIMMGGRRIAQPLIGGRPNITPTKTAPASGD